MECSDTAAGVNSTGMRLCCCYSPIFSMGPNTELSCAVEQFHLLCLNCHWHSAMPALAPLPTPLMWSWYSWHNFVWPGDSPLICVHKGEAPMRYWGCGSLTMSELCRLAFLERKHNPASGPNYRENVNLFYGPAPLCYIYVQNTRRVPKYILFFA